MSMPKAKVLGNIVGLAWYVALFASVAAPQQKMPLLQIDSPKNGTIVEPGQRIAVSVSSPANAAVQAVFIGGQGIGMEAVKSLPAQVTLTVDAKAKLGPSEISASVPTNQPFDAMAVPVTIDIERPDLPSKLSPLSSGLGFEVVGEEFPLAPSALFSDGSYLDVRNSSYLSYSSTDTTVATVGAEGMVTAAGPGTAAVVIRYAVAGRSIEKRIPVEVAPAIISAIPRSLDFGGQTVGTTSDARDMVLSNVSNRPVNIRSLDLGSVFPETDNCAGTTLPAGGACALRIKFAPDVAMKIPASITVHNDTTSIPPAFPVVGVGELPVGCLKLAASLETSGTSFEPATVRLEWTPQPSAEFYSVMRGITKDGIYIPIGFTSGAEYFDRVAIPANGGNYYYVVEADTDAARICDSNEGIITLSQ